MSAPAAGLIEGCIQRRARKAYRCECFPRERHADHAGLRCPVTIQPGDRYVEYMSEAAGYQSGSRFCQPCAEAVLAE